MKSKDKQKIALPQYLMDREDVNRSKAISNSVKQKKKEKAGKFNVKIQQTKAMSEKEIFSIVKTGKKNKKQWKRIIKKMTFTP